MHDRAIAQELAAAFVRQKADILLQEFSYQTSKQNQMLLFLKPEMFVDKNPNLIGAALEVIFSRLEHFSCEISGAYLMSAEALARGQVMDRHYGFINEMSRSASRKLSDAERKNAQLLCDVASGTPILGGHEILDRHSELSARTLDELWASKKSIKLKSGLYIQVFDLDKSQTVIVNGFHPYQLEHFTAPGRQILLLLVNSDLPWNLLRAAMLGDTFPERAAEGSIRGTFYRNPAAYGFGAVTIANNCVHMSAGPFEAAFELRNFLGSIPEASFAVEQTAMARIFAEIDAPHAILEAAIRNSVVEISPGVKRGLHDLTEEKDALSSAHLAKRFVEV